MVLGAKTIDQSNLFPHVQQLLYILTGLQPAIHTGRIDEFRDGEHLRFSFSAKNEDFQRLKAKLKFFSIQYCEKLFKDLEPRTGNPVLQFYITVAKDQFKTVQSYFAPGAATTLKLDNLKYGMLDLEEPYKKTLLMMLFSPDYIDGMKARNRDQYLLDGVIYYIAQLTLNTMPCFAYLKERGLEAGFSVVLEVESSQEEQASQSVAVTPLRDTRKRQRSTTVPDIEIQLAAHQQDIDKDKDKSPSGEKVRRI